MPRKRAAHCRIGRWSNRPEDIQRLHWPLREQARSHRCGVHMTTADVQRLHWPLGEQARSHRCGAHMTTADVQRLHWPLREQVRRTHDRLVDPTSAASLPLKMLWPLKILWERACSRRGQQTPPINPRLQTHPFDAATTAHTARHAPAVRCACLFQRSGLSPEPLGDPCVRS